MSCPDSVTPDSSQFAQRHYILGTAGHIDHGKTSLIRALTGVDTDRLPEEKRRGMTIDLGFADMRIGDIHFGIVDVPGHERFVRTMVAGATGIDIALIVVAADDSVMPQTIEHVEILNLLHVRRAVVAVTKADLVDEEMVELVVEDVHELLSGTPMAGAPILPVSSTAGTGLDRLREAIREQSAGVERSPSEPPFHMAVDRAFTVQGRGTVVTGSVVRGRVGSGDALEVWPYGESCKVRDLQTHGVHHEAIARGQRAAINISGIDKDRLHRGCELVTPGYFSPSRILGVRIHALSSNARAVKSTSVVRLGLGTAEVPARLVLFDQRTLEPGDTAYAQLRSGDAMTAVYGQRFIIRDETAARTIGGGVVLQPSARRKRRDRDTEIAAFERLDRGDAAQRVAEVLRAGGFAKPTDLQLCAKAGLELTDLAGVFDRLEADKRWAKVEGTSLSVVPEAVDDLTNRIVGRLRRYHRDHPDLPGRHAEAVLGWLERLAGKVLARPLYERLIAGGTLKRFGTFVCLPEFAPKLSAADEKILAAMVDEIRAGRFQPPAFDAVTAAAKADRKRLQRLVTLAVAMGELVKIDAKTYLHADLERELRDVVTGAIRDCGGITVAELREKIDSSRKYAVPFMEYLDRAGVTKRIDDRRVLADDVSD